MRDISKVFQGLYLADKNFYEGKEQIIKLWSHEILRVFHDRLVSFEDRDLLKSLMDDQIQNLFSLSYAEHCQTDGKDPIFVDFLTKHGDKAIYDEVTDFDKLRTFLID